MWAVAASADACPATVNWNFVASAPSHSQLCGVLAGFTFVAIANVFIFRPGPRNVEAIALFCASFLALALGSYLFGVLAGRAGDICLRAWSEGVLASGLLGLGSALMIAGLAWLLIDHANDRTRQDEWKRISPSLARKATCLGGIMIHGMTSAVALLLTRTVVDYVTVVLGRETPFIVNVAAYLAAAVTIAVANFVRVRTKRRKRKILPAGALSRAACYVAAYAIASLVLDAVIDGIPTESWKDSKKIIMVAPFGFGSIIPLALLTLVIVAFPVAGDSGGRRAWQQ